MREQKVLHELQKVLGKDNVIYRPEDLYLYSYDATPDVPREVPAVAVTPESTDQVAAVVNICRQHRLPIFPRGSATNLSGGTVPQAGGLVLLTLKMNRILELDPDNLTATVQPGVIIQHLNDASAPHGLIYPPDPGTVAVATMGGSVSECSGGLRGLKYGVTRDYVTGLQVVMADGSVARFGGKTVKNVTGYDMVRLFTGSEGTLGLITEIIVRLVPAPADRRSMLASFTELAAAGEAVAAIIRAKVIPATMEILDHTTISAVENYAHVGLPQEAAAVLLVEVDGLPEVVRQDAATVERLLKQCGGQVRLAADDRERDALWAARRAALPALARLRPTTVLEDATVPRSRIVDMLVAIGEIAKRHDLLIGTFGHAGDGNLHPTILTDESNGAEMARVHEAVQEIFTIALSMGGTLSGEHGVGLAKKRFLPQELGDGGVAAVRRIKQALDPENIFNPGKLVPGEE
ncbi:MAG TPA: FAD-linked oxidase C-terminal domain-containing protein [Spirochaetia bacterium]|nr:FAD-linked oxidase C-terminal domain-containing protein [Spirochaetia bacterium]